MKKHNIVFLVTTILLILTATGCSSHHIKKDKLSDKAAVSKYRNVIVMVPDGCSMSIETFARLYKGSDIHLDKLHTGSVRTCSANSIITDSAAAATAFATGHKTTTGFLGIAPSTEDLLPFFKPDATPYYPLPTLLEGAKFNGKSTGLVVTSVTGHATPGGFAAHASSRNMSDDITEQMVYQDIDVVFSGGGCNLLPVGVQYRSASGDIWNGKRKDTENLITSLLERGYEFISSRAELEELGNKKAWGVFNEKNLVPDIDRDELNPSQPSLAEMTRKAIEILSNNEKGFFLMVEGSQVDYAGHDNDPVYMVTEFLAFDEAVGVAIEYAQKNDDTLVVIFPDHDTG
ncbi:MAG: alkaline phosphatase, partial [Deltaproteobacteria bacterium]|nr:alkaline phosphatase [Deltaproteobacteria bacterium]